MMLKAKILKIFGIIWIGCASIPVIISLPHILKSGWENGIFDTSGLAVIFLLSPGLYAYWWKDQLKDKDEESSLKSEIKRATILIGLIVAVFVVIIWIDQAKSGSGST